LRVAGGAAWEHERSGDERVRAGGSNPSIAETG
jgi:hypothetical protein